MVLRVTITMKSEPLLVGNHATAGAAGVQVLQQGGGVRYLSTVSSQGGHAIANNTETRFSPLPRIGLFRFRHDRDRPQDG